MSVIVIDKWYGEEKTKLVNKNKIERVEFVQLNVDVVGLELDKLRSDKTLKGFTTKTQARFNWDFLNTVYADDHFNNVTYSKKMQVPDLNFANYGIAIKVIGTETTIKESELEPTWSTFEMDSLTCQRNGDGVHSGTAVLFSPDTVKNGQKIIPKFTVDVDGISVDFGNVLTFSSYIQKDSSNKITFFWQTVIDSIEIKITVGNYKVADSKIAFGQLDSKNSLATPANELLSNQTKIDGAFVSQKIADEILVKYKNGLKTIELCVPICKYFDVNGNLAIDCENGVKKLIEVADIILIKKRGTALYRNSDGEPMLFEVTQANIDYTNGKAKMTIKGREVKNGTMAT